MMVEVKNESKNLVDIKINYPDSFINNIIRFISKYGNDNILDRIINLAKNGRYSVGSLISEYIDIISDKSNYHIDKTKVYTMSEIYDEWIDFINDKVIT